MSTLPKLLIFSTVVSLLCVFIRHWRHRRLRGGRPLPPGPKGLPILGNILGLDISAPWASFADWAKKYGDLVYFTVFGYEVVVINSEELAHTLLDQRSAVYSDKPHMSVVDLFGMDFSTGSMPYGNRFRRHCKMYHVGLKKEATREYQSMQLKKVHKFLENLIASPAQFPAHTRTLTTGIVMAVAYGYDVAPVDDQFATTIERYMSLFMKAFTPGRLVLAGVFPFLQYIPSWLPGAGYLREAEECRKITRDALDHPIEYVKAEMAKGTARQSLVKDLLCKHTVKDNTVVARDEETIKEVAANLFLAGGETTDAVIHVFLLAMVLHPEVQIKAQEEIDRVVDDNRLPQFSDREKLPYVEAVYLETLRWNTIVPLAIPHTTSTSDVYNGYYIPRGVIVLINIWAMMNDEMRFPDPKSFKPERHLSSTGGLFQGSAIPPFSFGRRQCPGRHLADQSIWATIVSILATIRIGKAKDSTGCEIDVKPEFTMGFGPRPKHFVCSFESRSVNAERLIHASNKGEEAAPALGISTPVLSPNDVASDIN